MKYKSYQIDGEVFYQTYLNFRSKVVPRIRRQKVLKLDENGQPFRSVEELRKAERRWVRKLTAEIAFEENRGLLWEEIISRWESAHLRGLGSKTYVSNTVTGWSSTLQKWTKDWLSRPAREITSTDVRTLFRYAESQGKSPKFQKSLKVAVNAVYRWGLEERLIDSVLVSPTQGISPLGKTEEVMPEILSKEQVKQLLSVAQERDHPWYPIWVMATKTGARTGELQGLRKEDCSLVSREVALAQDKLPSKDRNYGLIAIQRSWNIKEWRYTTTKGKYWRNVPVSGELYWFLQTLMERDFGRDEYGRFLLPRFDEWSKGRQAEVLRDFCESEKLTSIKFHTLRACFATHLLAMGVPPIKVQKVGGWRNLKTLEIYARLAGIDVSGVTEGLDFIPVQRSEEANVVNLQTFQAQRPTSDSRL